MTWILRVDLSIQPKIEFLDFFVFDPSEWNWNMKRLKSEVFEIIPDDTELEPISWELNIKNPL